MSVQATQSSITRGKTATYTVQVSTQNGSASNVSVTLTSQPSSQKPEFTSGCTKGDGTASCTVASVTTAKPVDLDAQIAVASSATSVTSLKLTATASVASTVKWTPPAAAGTTAVTSAAASTSSHSATASPSVSSPPLAPGLIPNLNDEASMLVGAGNAAGLFPSITPSTGPGASQAAQSQGGRQNADPIANASPVSSGTQVLAAQVAGLIALGLAIMLTVTRLSLRKRSGSGGSGS